MLSSGLSSLLPGSMQEDPVWYSPFSLPSTLFSIQNLVLKLHSLQGSLDGPDKMKCGELLAAFNELLARHIETTAFSECPASSGSGTCPSGLTPGCGARQGWRVDGGARAAMSRATGRACAAAGPPRRWPPESPQVIFASPGAHSLGPLSLVPPQLCCPRPPKPRFADGSPHPREVP